MDEPKIGLETLRGRVDFAVITIREDEFLSVLDRFKAPRYAAGNRRYEIGSMTSDDGNEYLFAIARCITQGEGEAQRVTAGLIADLNPKLLMLVGIGGAVPSSDFTLGDVVCATSVHNFSVRAALEGRRDSYQTGGGEMHPAILSLMGSLPKIAREIGCWNEQPLLKCNIPSLKGDLSKKEHYYGSPQWQGRVRKSITTHFVDGRRRQPLIATARPVASSDALVKSATMLDHWLDSARSTAAVEMELAGVYYAARNVAKEYPILAIRGISDVVGLRRDDAWTGFACHSAASFAYALARSGELQDILVKPSGGGAAGGSSSRSDTPTAAKNHIAKASENHDVNQDRDAQQNPAVVRHLSPEGAIHNPVPQCSELTIGEILRTESSHFDLWAELRFGRYDFPIDDIEPTQIAGDNRPWASVGITEAFFRLVLDRCRIAIGNRTGDVAEADPFIMSQGKNSWRIVGPKDDRVDDRYIMSRRVIGSTPLCKINVNEGEHAQLEVQVTCLPKAIAYEFHDSSMSENKARILGIFISKCIGTGDEGVVLSSAKFEIGTK